MTYQVLAYIGGVGHCVEVLPRLHLIQRCHHMHEEGAAERPARGHTKGRGHKQGGPRTRVRWMGGGGTLLFPALVI